MPQAKNRKRKGPPLRDVVPLARAHLVASLDALLGVFSRAGAGPRALLTKERTTAGSYERLRNVAEALKVWHTSDEFLTSEGIPKVLGREGPISLSSLAKAVTTRRNALAALKSDLERLNRLHRRSQSFSPKNRSAVLRSADSMSLAYSTVAISRLIGTIAYNFSGPDLPRYERQVSDVDILASDLPIFQRFVAQQGQYFIDAVDDWLAKRAATPAGKGIRVSVGVGAFAWVDAPRASLANARRSAPRIRPR